MSEPLIYELGGPGHQGAELPPLDVPDAEEAAGGELPGLPEGLLRKSPPLLPEVTEPEVVRHYTRLSEMNYAIDNGFYPLGSCTMKYNPKRNDAMAALPGFRDLHPLTPEAGAQGALELMARLEAALAEITGMARFSLQPVAGAQGEFTGLSIVRAYHESRGEERTRVIVPDSAHGTNPASAAMAGYQVVEVRSDARGGIDVEDLDRVLGPDVAALMLTNPNTLGLFDERTLEIARRVHEAGALLYYDGANLNAILGLARPGDMGFDIVHLNLHKTFSGPHGGGGPGSGPVGVAAGLERFLPRPLVVKEGDRYRLEWGDPDGLDRPAPESVGKVQAFWGNFAVAVRAYAYVLTLGAEGLRRVAETSVLNANYLMRRLARTFELPYDRPCMHEFVLSGERLKKETGVRVLDVAKRLLDYGLHPGSVYFPLIVEEALMIEPTETESLATLDAYAEALEAIAREAREEPQKLREAPFTTPVRRLDEVAAARRPVLRWSPAGERRA
ncbi:MAG: aminomethyl-transferring glycine dehydrogenase subunit GcvPB [Bacillota bacterium]|nr:aminomethyl-transferring glycine dehydrogenase subunit GcvPB [Bacillota bacterium]